MFELIVETVKYLTENLVEESQHGKSIRWEMKDFFGRYCADILASTMFGVKLNSFENYENDFIRITKTAYNSTTIKTGVRLFLINLLPKLTNALSFELVPHRSKQHI